MWRGVVSRTSRSLVSIAFACWLNAGARYTKPDPWNRGIVGEQFHAAPEGHDGWRKRCECSNGSCLPCGDYYWQFLNDTACAVVCAADNGDGLVGPILHFDSDTA